MQEKMNLNQVLAKINECNEKLEELKNQYSYYDNQIKFYEEKLNVIGIPQEDYKRYAKEISSNRKKQQKCNADYNDVISKKDNYSGLRDNLVNLYYDALNSQNALEEERKKDKDILKEIFVAIKEEKYDKVQQIAMEKAEIVNARNEQMKKLEAQKEEILNGAGIIANDIKDETNDNIFSENFEIAEEESNPVENSEEVKKEFLTSEAQTKIDFEDVVQEKIIDPNEEVNEVGEYKIVDVENKEEEIVEENEAKKEKTGIIDTMKVGAQTVKEKALAALQQNKLDITGEEKKRPKFIKNIAGWTKNHTAAVGVAVGAIALALIVGGPIAALASTAGEAAVGYVAYKSTLGKGR